MQFGQLDVGGVVGGVQADADLVGFLGLVAAPQLEITHGQIVGGVLGVGGGGRQGDGLPEGGGGLVVAPVLKVIDAPGKGAVAQLFELLVLPGGVDEQVLEIEIGAQDVHRTGGPSIQGGIRF